MTTKNDQVCERCGRLAELLSRVVDKWLPHSGSCCTFDDNGDVLVTTQSCKCSDLAKECRAALTEVTDP